MAFKKIIESFSKYNDKEKLKSILNVKKYIPGYNDVEFKEFWKKNNKFVIFCSKILAGLIIIGIFLNSKLIMPIKTDPKVAGIYFGATIFIFSFVIIFIINFYVNIGVKQDYNTDEIMRRQMKYKGVDWHKEEELLKKSDEQ